MRRSHWILVIFYILTLCQHLDFQSTATNIATQTQSTYSTSNPIASTVLSSNASPTQVYNSSNTTGPTTPTAQLTAAPTPGKYVGGVRMKCSFPNNFLPDYNNVNSPILKTYLQNIFNMMSSSLAKRSLQLVLIKFFTISPGSVVVDMSLSIQSNVILANPDFLNTVQTATINAFNGAVTILSIRIRKSFAPIPQSNSWIVGVVIVVFIGAVLMIIGLALCHHYTPHYFYCTCLETSRTSPPVTTTVDTPHTVYGIEYNSYNDKTAIIERDGNEFV